VILCTNTYDDGVNYARQHYFGYQFIDGDHQVVRDFDFTYLTPEGVVVATRWAEVRQTGEKFRHAAAHQRPHLREPCDGSSSLQMADKLSWRVGSHFRGTQAGCANHNPNVTIEFDDARSRIIPQIIALAAD